MATGAYSGGQEKARNFVSIHREFRAPAGSGERPTVSAVAFLDLNGYVLRPKEADAVLVIMAFAAGEIDDAALTAWFAGYSEPKRR